MDNKATITNIDLSEYNPPQLYLMLNPIKYDVRECFRLVLMDLILKKALFFEKITKSPAPGVPPANFEYIKRGTSYDSYRPNEYENHFLHLFKEGDIKIQVRYFGKAVMESSLERIENLQTEIMKTEPVKGNLLPAWNYWFNGNMKHSNEGKSIAIAASNRLIQIAEDLEVLLKSDKEKAVKVLKEFGNNFLLIPGFDKDMFTDFKSTFKELERESGCSSWIGCDTGCTFDISDLGDAGCDTSGCSSGCSGCSGCSACSD